jgi:hypothetical protein
MGAVRERRVIHELCIADEGLSTERVIIRTIVPEPKASREDYMSVLTQYQSGVPCDMEEYLLQLMQFHEDKLSMQIGARWLEGARYGSP